MRRGVFFVLFADILTTFPPALITLLYWHFLWGLFGLKFLNTGRNMCSMLVCRTWQALFLMKACFVGGFNKELTLWHLARFLIYFFFYVAFKHFYLNVPLFVFPSKGFYPNLWVKSFLKAFKVYDILGANLLVFYFCRSYTYIFLQIEHLITVYNHHPDSHVDYSFPCSPFLFCLSSLATSATNT